MSWPSPGLLVCAKESQIKYFFQDFFFSWGEGGLPGKYDAADAWAIKNDTCIHSNYSFFLQV